MAKKSVSDNMLPITTEEEARLRRWRSEFNLDYKLHKAWLEKKVEWDKFYDGNQLSSEERQALQARKQPEVVVNLIKPRIDGVIGDFLGRRVMMRARDKGSQDFEVAKHVTEALRYVEQSTKFDEQEAMVAEDLAIGGVGYYKIHLEFDFLEPEIKITYRPQEDIIVDRRCRNKDLSDAKRIYETVWTEVEDLVEIYPEHEQFIKEAASLQKETFTAQFHTEKGKSSIGDDYSMSDNVAPAAENDFEFDTFLDPKRQRIRVINVWERVPKKVQFAFHPDLEKGLQKIDDFSKEELEAFKRAFPDASTFSKINWEVNSAIFIANKELEFKENIREHDSSGKFPFVRAIFHIERETKTTPYGIVKQYVDPQKEYNKRRSKLLHKSNVNRIIAEEGAIANSDIERIRKEAARPDGVILYAAGRQFSIDNDRPDQNDVYMLELAHSEIERSGVSREFIGTETKALSGRAIGLRQVEGNKMLRPFYAALRNARRNAFELVLEEIQQYWTSEKLIKITDDPLAGEIILNQKVVNPQTGQVEILNNLKLGKYDIKVDEDAETPNQRLEIFSQLVELGKIAAQAGEPFPLEMVIKSSDLPNKKEWLDQIAIRRQQLQQQQQQLLQQQMLAKAGAVPQ